MIKARHRRALVIAAGLLTLGIAAALILQAFNRNLVFFFSPSQVLASAAPHDRSFRLGGLVEAGSLKRDGLTVQFMITDLAQRVPVTYSGLLPDLFREGKGVVAQGRLDHHGVFRADQVLAKHDENYMPPEAAAALKQAQGGTPHAPELAASEGPRR
jgi:cytochrome c-type biogenesis protein CcmE